MANKQPDKVGIHCSLCCQVKVISTNFCSNTYLCSQVAHMHIMFLRIEYNVYIITIMGQLRWHNRGSFTPHLSYFYVKTRWFVGRGCHRQQTQHFWKKWQKLLFRITFSKTKAMKSSPLLGPFGVSEFWEFSLLKIQIGWEIYVSNLGQQLVAEPSCALIQGTLLSS